MTKRTVLGWRSVAMVLVLGVLVAAGCRPPNRDGNNTGKSGATPTRGVLPKPTDHISELEADMQVQLTRSTSDAAIQLPWLNPTPTVGADAQAGTRTWPGLAVLIGRKQVFVGAKAIAPTHCKSKLPAQCSEEALKQQNAVAVFGFDAEQLSDGKLTALAPEAAAWKDKQVAVIADRRVNWQAVEAVMATLRAAGAKPLLAAGSHDGDLVDALGVGTALPEAPTLIAARRAADPGGSEPGGIPADATTLTISVTSGGVSVEIGREQGESVYPEVMGNTVESLIALCQRVRQAAQKVSSVTIRGDPDASLEQVTQAIDGVRDDCGRTSRGQRCTSRVQLFSMISLELNGAAPEPAKVGLDAPLHLNAPGDAPAPGLHLGDAPANGAQPAAPGLHLTP